MRNRVRTVAAALLLLGSCATRAQHLKIGADAIRAHVGFLASDLLEGREAGSRGHEIAAAYVATQFEGAGVAPAGDGGTYLQRIRFRTYRLDVAHSAFCIEAGGGSCQPFEHRKDVVLGVAFAAERAVTAEVVHAGFGIVAPELGHDDYAGIDVREKIVALLARAPAVFRKEGDSGSHIQGRIRLE